MKWARAARVAAEQLQGTLYARYYDLPAPSVASTWAVETKRRWGAPTAELFADECRRRAKEAEHGDGRGVARNGAVLEQSQILTTHDLAVLVDGLGLEDVVRGLAPELALACLRFVVRRQRQRAPRFKARLQMLKNTAYAWRQALYFLSFCDQAGQRRACDELERLADGADRLAPIVEGLRHVVEGGRFGADGRATREGRPVRRFLGWSVGSHWLLP